MKKKQGQDLEHDEKEKRKRKRREKKEEQEKARKAQEAADMMSYLNEMQYNSLYDELNSINSRIHNNGSIIDTLERKLLEILKMKEEKRRALATGTL